jgi:hypothetical protein
LRELLKFRPHLEYDVAETGVWVTESGQLRLLHRTLQGDTLLIARSTRYDAVALAETDQALLSEGLNQLGASPRDFAYGKQIVSSVNVMPDGHVLVQIELAETGSASSIFGVFSSGGSFLGELEFPHPIDPSVPLAFRGDTLLAVVRDDLDVQSVLRAQIVR